MGVIAKWNGHKFQISASVMRGFTQLQVKGACETYEPGHALPSIGVVHGL